MLSKVCSIWRWKVFRTWHVEGHGEQVHSWFGSHCGLLTFGRWMGDVIKARWVVGSFPQLLSLSKRKTGWWGLAFGIYMHASYYCALLYCVSEILHFLQIKDLWQPSIGQVYQCYVSNGICSLCVSVSHFGNTIFQTVSWPLKVKVKSLRHVWLFVIPWTVVYHTPPSMGFSRQEYWNGLPFPPPEDLPDPGIEPGSPALWADVLPSEPPG